MCNSSHAHNLPGINAQVRLGPQLCLSFFRNGAPNFHSHEEKQAGEAEGDPYGRRVNVYLLNTVEETCRYLKLQEHIYHMLLANGILDLVECGWALYLS